MYNSKQTTQISKANSKRVECFVVTDWNLYFDMKVQNIFYISQYGRRILVCMQNVCFYRSFCAQSLNTDLLYLLACYITFSINNSNVNKTLCLWSVVYNEIFCHKSIYLSFYQIYRKEKWFCFLSKSCSLGSLYQSN